MSPRRVVPKGGDPISSGRVKLTVLAGSINPRPMGPPDCPGIWWQVGFRLLWLAVLWLIAWAIRGGVFFWSEP